MDFGALELLKGEFLKAPPRQAFRESALRRLQETGIPLSDNEEWKYTSLREWRERKYAWLQSSFGVSSTNRHSTIASEMGIEPARLSPVQNFRASDGSVSTHDSSISSSSLVQLGLALSSEIWEPTPSSFEQAGIQILDMTVNDDKLDKGLVGSTVQIKPKGGTSSQFVQVFEGSADYDRIHNTRVALSPDASLELVIFQKEPATTTHFHFIDLEVPRGSDVKIILLSLGGELARTEIRANVTGPSSRVQLWGLCLGGNQQKHDVFTSIRHQSADSWSRQTFKGIYSGKSRGTFCGLIEIDKEAQRVDSRQINKNLLIGAQSGAHTKPQLRVHADDVKASHGATVGRLSEEELFYLQTRGLERKEAQNMVATGFALDVLEQLESTALKQHMRKALNSQLERLLKNEP